MTWDIKDSRFLQLQNTLIKRLPPLGVWSCYLTVAGSHPSNFPVRVELKTKLLRIDGKTYPVSNYWVFPPEILLTQLGSSDSLVASFDSSGQQISLKFADREELRDFQSKIQRMGNQPRLSDLQYKAYLYFHKRSQIILSDCQSSKFKKVVVKRIPLRNFSKVKDAFEERIILEMCRDQTYLPQLLDCFIVDKVCHFVIPFYSGGDLFTRNPKYGFPVSMIKIYGAELWSALCFLHRRMVVYRDLKPENLLLDSTGHLILTDFGMSKVLDSPDQRLTTFCGSNWYYSPEMFAKSVGMAHDWWQYGCCLYELSTGLPPFYRKNATFNARFLKHAILDTNGLDPDFIGLVSGCLIRNETHRFTESMISQDPFFESVTDWSNLKQLEIPSKYTSVSWKKCFEKRFWKKKVKDTFPKKYASKLGAGIGWYLS